MLNKKFLSWRELFNGDNSDSVRSAFTPTIVDYISNTFNIDSYAIENMGIMITMNNCGLSYFKRSDISLVNKQLYSSSFISFCENNKDRLMFSLLNKNVTLDKTRSLTDHKTGDKANNYEEINTDNTTNTEINSNDKAGFYNSAESVYVSSLPKNEINGSNNSTIESHSKRGKNIDETTVVTETIKDPYSFVHINDFVNRYKTFYDIISEYYKEYTVPFR